MALRIEHVSKSFGNVEALIDVDLEFPDGQLICLLGPSGCGKTTLLRCIAGLETPSAGRIRLDGRDLTHTPAHKRDFGMVFQSLALFPHLSVGENIAYGLKIRGVDQAARRARVAELLELVRLPGVMERPVAQLSGGQRQRVAIARAIVRRPAFVVADEPVSALDMTIQQQVLALFTSLQKQYRFACLFISHDLAAVEQIADRVLVMQQGRIVESGTRDEVFDRPQHPYTRALLRAALMTEGPSAAAG